MTAHQYKRRKIEEAEAIAQMVFRSQARLHLTGSEIEEMMAFGAVSSGSPTYEWEAIVGRPVSDREFYQFEIYKRSEECPYIERVYAALLVSRDRANEDCHVQWKPELEPYDGKWFS